MTQLKSPAPYIAATASEVRMLGDRILLRPLKWQPSKILEVVRHGRALRGEVMAIGRGHNPLKYKTRGDKTKTMDYSRYFRPTEVKVGDIVELGGLNVFDGQGYSFPEVIVGTETMLICSERDVAGVVEQGVTVEAHFTAADIINAPPLPPATSPNDPRNVLMRQIDEDVMANVPRETTFPTS